ncbi:hypothetical protein NEOLEDRAFT_258538 [Neolentinus lepideus HHB14362 ss-1]|uniref:Uncharacterized protein n=1 Tax=Neolentinus lepideus HHB14362 ss-1 TaxID=1314782 RepID=A0A165M8V9_9AGAM|nr:hypothetical protein NEOLEDRAFT_258538 [Neolentinus lepideus HHB14362 ss-1]
MSCHGFSLRVVGQRPTPCWIRTQWAIRVSAGVIMFGFLCVSRPKSKLGGIQTEPSRCQEAVRVAEQDLARI